jgi:hypothetical protein
MLIYRTLGAFLPVLVVSTSTAAAQRSEPRLDSARAQIHTSLRAFYFNLAHQDWEALTADILAAKVVAHRPAPDAMVIAAADRASGLPLPGMMGSRALRGQRRWLIEQPSRWMAIGPRCRFRAVVRD